MNLVKLTLPTVHTKTALQTVIMSLEQWQSYPPAPCQRDKRDTKKVREAATYTEATKTLSGVITLALWNGMLYMLDGQHRVLGLELSGLEEAKGDLRILWLETVEEIGEEWHRLNSVLVQKRPDDNLRALEPTVPAVRTIHTLFPFIGFGQIRRNGTGPWVSMSLVLKAWRGSRNEIPQITGLPDSVAIAREMTEEEVAHLGNFLSLALQGFGLDKEYSRLWGTLNLTLCMWLYRRTVVTPSSSKASKVTRITPELFTKCLLALSANSTYFDYIEGRGLSFRDRSPSYARIKAIFGKRLESELNRKIYLPAPEWSTGHGAR